MRGAPQSGFAKAIRVIRALSSALDRRPTSGRAARELGPVLAEATPLPPQNGIGSNDDEGLPPARPDSRQTDPEKPVRRTKPRPSCRSLVDGELLAQGQILDGEPAVATEEDWEKPKQVEQESDHRVRIVSGSALRHQLLACRTRFWLKTRSRCRGRGSLELPTVRMKSWPKFYIRRSERRVFDRDSPSTGARKRATSAAR
jgi:hypothetical protein